MTDNVAAPGLLAPMPPSPPAAMPSDEPPAHTPPVANADDTPSPDRRRRYLLLLLLLGFLLLVTFAIWYFLFRQPITNLLPNLDLAKPPAYQTSVYGMNRPLGVAVTPDGSRMYVTQGGGDQATIVLDATGNQLGVLAPPQDVIDRATQLYVAVNPKTGDVYATDRSAGAVFIYGADGVYKSTFDPGTGISIWQPLAVAFDGAGNLYVSDVGGDFQKVHVFGPDGTWLRDLGEAGLFAFPNGIGIDTAGNVYVSDSNNGRLIVFDTTGAQLGKVERGTAAGRLGLPRGVAVDGKGRIFVVDSVGQSVQLFRALQESETAPAFLTAFGREGTVDGTFEFPNGVALDGRGRVYITDWNNDRLQIWSY